MASPLISVLLVVAVIQVCVADTGFVFDDQNYQGESRYIEVPDGDTTCYNIRDIDSNLDDRAESIRVTAGSCWDLYENTGCSGGVVHATENIPSFGDLNNKISAIRQC